MDKEDVVHLYKSDQFSGSLHIHTVEQPLCLVPKHVRHPKRKPRAQLLPVAPSPPQPLATINLSSVSTYLPLLGISYKGNHIIQGLYVWLLSFGLTFLRFIHLTACINTYFVAFYS